MKNNKDKNSWNFIDRIIAKFRYIQVDKYVPQNGNMVDIGCGQEGKFLLRHKDKIAHGYGFDFKIKDHKVDNIDFVNNSKSGKLSLDKNGVDVIFLNAVLEHLPEPKTILSDAINALKVGGNIVMTTPTPMSKPLLEFLAYKLHVINEAEIREHVHYYSKKDINNLVSELSESCKLELIKYKRFEFGLNSLIAIKKISENA